MGKLRFVQPAIERLHLSDGDWVEVKKRLSVGEERAAFQRIVGEINNDGWRRPNIEMMGIAEMAAYIVAWSFRDAQDKPVPVSIDAIKQLDSESFAELEKVLEGHIKASVAEIEALKNNQGGETKSVQTLPPAA